MAIAESGGPTTQAGISYQNAIAALYLGRMLDSRSFSVAQKVTKVRVEAPEHVDDIVITFSNEVKWYIQAKESISKGSSTESTWGKLWKDFEMQFIHSSFNKGKDRLQLICGTHKDEIYEAKGLVERTSSCESYEEWQGRLTANQLVFFEHLNKFLSLELKSNNDLLLQFFASIDIEIEPRQMLEKDKMRYWMPESNLAPTALFSILRDKVGGDARIRGSHTVKSLQEWLQENQIVISESVSLSELRSAVYSCSSIMRHQKNTIGKTGKKLLRDDYKDISKWLLETSDKEPVGVLLDQAGTGKTIVIQEVLEELESRQVDVLAIKADQQLLDAQSLKDVQSKLDLPVRMERLADTLAIQGRFVVLIDQIDALSLSMAHDQGSLNLALDLISRLRSIPGVRIIISCRKFDFDSDPRLKNLENCKVFSLEEFSNEEVGNFLCDVGVDYKQLLPTTQNLLRIPLHLNLFLMAYESDGSKELLQDRSLSSLQELYQLVWDWVIMKQHADAPPAWERERALFLIAQYMDHKQRITVPKFLLSQKETNALERAFHWLSSEGIILNEGKELSFFHQTFFDYCYARNFVQQGYSLVDVLVASPQGLFQRPQLVQVLSFLRGQEDKRSYFMQLNALLKSDDLRYHLKNHLYRWFAALASPTEQEWRLMKRTSADLNIRSQLLRFSYLNPGWFEYWRTQVIPEIMDGQDERFLEEVFSYLTSMIDLRQSEIIVLVLPYYNKSQCLEQLVENLVLQIRSWKCEEAVKLFEVVMEKSELDNRVSYLGWKELAQYDSKAFCRILRNFMNQAIKNYRRKKEERNQIQTESYQFNFISLNKEMNKLGSTLMDEALQIVVNKSALYFLEIIIPWLIEAVKIESYEVPETEEDFIPDSLFRNWYDRIQVEFDVVLNETLVKAFILLAKEHPQIFVEKINYLYNIPHDSIQFLIAHILRQVPEQHSITALNFILADPRRLKIGNEDFESRYLIKSIMPYLQESERQDLEDFIITRLPLNKKWKLDGYMYHDLSQCRILSSISSEYLSSHGKQRLMELERKFPEYQASDNPRRIRGGVVGSPIDAEAVRKMTDQQWKKAMAKYQRGVRHSDWSKGGAESLARLLQEQVRKEPERFINLFSVNKDGFDHNYVQAVLYGITDSTISGSEFFAAISLFEYYEDRNIRRTIAWAVEKRADEEVPERIIGLLISYFYDTSLIEESYTEDPVSGCHNSVRGAAMNALMKIYREKEKEKWEILDYAVGCDDISLRAGAIYELIYMIRIDRERSLDLFENAIEGNPQLYRIAYTNDFCYWAMGQPFERLVSKLDAFITDEKDEIQQRGAELVALSLISENLFESQYVKEQVMTLLTKTINGNPYHRRGVARILSYNFPDNVSSILMDGLLQLMNDEDEEVQRQISFLLLDIKKNCKELRQEIRTIIMAFAGSRSMTYGGKLGEILWQHATDYPEWTLSAISEIMGNEHLRNRDNWYLDSRDLILAVINIYTDPLSDEVLQNRAMDIFDILMKSFSMHAQGVLAEWDRR
ncbi:ATP-binding protein [Paenibacillus sp. FSL R7-0345]|uniref:NACHT domain-containing protein n=1 Tax=Paenibacillus sp. FSL R7-0345 TaxID=2954535 RepID=UPI00315B27E5